MERSVSPPRSLFPADSVKIELILHRESLRINERMCHMDKS